VSLHALDACHSEVRPGQCPPDNGASYSVILLAGGLGARLGGQDKATLLLAGEPLLGRVHRCVAPLTDDVVIVLRPDQELGPALAAAVQGAAVVRDLPGYSGVLSGMAAGLAAARHGWSLVLACDMPFVQIPLLRYLWSLHGDWDAIVPRLAVGLEPLHAFYHKRCLSPLCAALAQGLRRVSGVYETLRVRYVDEGETAPHDPQRLGFFNVNTLQDLARAHELLAR